MLMILNQKGPIGRYRLKDMLNLSEHEGIIRYMLTDLQNQSYVSASKLGCSLTQKGKVSLEKRLRAHGIVDVKPFYTPILTTAPISIGLHIRNKADKTESPMKLRDLAVRGGAVGATIILFKEGKLTIPSVNTDFFSKHSTLTKKIHEAFTLENNDILAIVSAEEEWRGVEASLTIAKILSSS